MVDGSGTSTEIACYGATLRCYAGCSSEGGCYGAERRALLQSGATSTSTVLGSGPQREVPSRVLRSYRARLRFLRCYHARLRCYAGLSTDLRGLEY
eukprot:3558894-Rhodomonas_salina.1